MTTENKAEANVIWSVVFLLLAAMAVCAILFEEWGIGWKLLLGIVALILMAAAALFLSVGLQQLQYRWDTQAASLAARRAEGLPEIATWRAKTAYIEGLERLSDTTKQILLADPALARAIMGTMGPAVGLATAGEIIPYEFVDAFLAANEQREVLVAVRDWKSGERRYASALMKHLVTFGYCLPWGGNQTAKWASEHAAADFIRWAYGERIKRVWLGASPPSPFGSAKDATRSPQKGERFWEEGESEGYSEEVEG